MGKVAIFYPAPVTPTLVRSYIKGYTGCIYGMYTSRKVVYEVYTPPNQIDQSCSSLLPYACIIIFHTTNQFATVGLSGLELHEKIAVILSTHDIRSHHEEQVIEHRMQ